MDRRVYFAEADWPEHGSLIKIGVSGRLPARMQELGLLHSDIRCLASAPGDRFAEQLLHEMFKDSRVSGEWFYPISRIRNLAHFCHIEDKLPDLIKVAAEARARADQARWVARAAFVTARRSIRGLANHLVTADNVVELVRRGEKKAA